MQFTINNEIQKNKRIKNVGGRNLFIGVFAADVLIKIQDDNTDICLEKYFKKGLYNPEIYDKMGSTERAKIKRNSLSVIVGATD